MIAAKYKNKMICNDRLSAVKVDHILPSLVSNMPGFQVLPEKHNQSFKQMIAGSIAWFP